jgi:hypothetical protein
LQLDDLGQLAFDDTGLPRHVVRRAPYSVRSRGDDNPDGDIDILVEFEPGAEGTIYDYVRLKEFVASLFNGPVDVIDRGAQASSARACRARWARHTLVDDPEQAGYIAKLLRLHADL